MNLFLKSETPYAAEIVEQKGFAVSHADAGQIDAARQERGPAEGGMGNEHGWAQSRPLSAVGIHQRRNGQPAVALGIGGWLIGDGNPAGVTERAREVAAAVSTE
mgnify:CR=1 FL=1